MVILVGGPEKEGVAQEWNERVTRVMIRRQTEARTGMRRN